ncbi:MAG: nuclear transport factor 2 family protein [Propionicimonas sp.]|uniref:nuclear transport factor 2 family protein n=1 Tax=Propionicimonas sp. TaxID=1955623 RepID=UPI003D12DC81
MDDLERRVRRLEDRQAIIDVVVRYCVTVDARDWDGFATCFAPTVRRDDGELTRDEFVAVVAGALPGFRRTQHVSSNHVVTVDPEDPDRATCDSDMYAQHELAASSAGTWYLLRARYHNGMVRTPDGWRIASILTTNRWEEGNLNAVAEAIEVVRQSAGG